MKHTYTILGMTCNRCKATVEERLNELDGVKATVDLQKQEAIVEMEQYIPLEELQKQIAPKYSIKQKEHFQPMDGSVTEKTELQQLFPLFLIFGYIVIASILLNYDKWAWSAFMLDFMGLFYIIFSFFKFLDLKNFPDSFRTYDPLAKKMPIYAKLYPFIELILGLFFLMRIQLNIALIVTVIILGVTTVGVTKVLFDKRSIQCACLGTVLKLPMTKATFIENSIMLVMALIMLFLK